MGPPQRGQRCAAWGLHAAPAATRRVALRLETAVPDTNDTILLDRDGTAGAVSGSLVS